jgi:D-glycero-D-manno-heptose 1,7-bisphosphate phosphatase
MARGLLSIKQLLKIHAQLHRELEHSGAHVDAIYFCPHDPSLSACKCRKPEVGLLTKALAHFKVSAENAVIIGDSLSDMQAGCTCGLYCVLVRTDSKTRKPGFQKAALLANAVVHSLPAAVELLFQRFSFPRSRY